MGERSGAYRVLVGKSEGKRPLGRPMHRWEVNIKVNLQEVGWGAYLVQGRDRRWALLNAFMNLWVP